MIIEISWAAVGAIIAGFGIIQAMLAFYVRSLIQQHTLNCPYPKRFEEALEKVINKLDRHLERSPDRERSFPGGL